MTPLIAHYWKTGFCTVIPVVLMGCVSLLPHSKQESNTPWQSYPEAQAMFDQIIPDKTRLEELRAMGVDSAKTPNVAVLSHADLLRKITAGSSVDVRSLAPALQDCLVADKACLAYELEQTYLERRRYGNFWMDFLNFHRKVDVSGWQFDAIVVVKNDTVIYKLWSGKPNIHTFEEERSPLGPLQGIGATSVLPRY